MSLLVLAAAAIIPAGEIFTCTPTRVWDGDGPVWCAEGPRIRLTGIAARASPRGGDLSCAMVRSGYALRWQRYWGDHRCQ